jgi:hypothetical protein
LSGISVLGVFVFLTFIDKSASAWNTVVAFHREYSRYRIYPQENNRIKSIDINEVSTN